MRANGNQGCTGGKNIIKKSSSLLFTRSIWRLSNMYDRSPRVFFSVLAFYCRQLEYFSPFTNHMWPRWLFREPLFMLRMSPALRLSSINAVSITRACKMFLVRTLQSNSLIAISEIGDIQNSIVLWNASFLSSVKILSNISFDLDSTSQLFEASSADINATTVPSLMISLALALNVKFRSAAWGR